MPTQRRHSILDNPMPLRILGAAVGAGDWPMNPTFDTNALKKRYNIARKEMLRAQRTLKRATLRWEIAHTAYRIAQHEECQRERS